MKEKSNSAWDAKLSTAQRKKLSGSTFCGPGRSFPVPDCAHVTAARRLIGRAKVGSATKSKILLESLTYDEILDSENIVRILAYENPTQNTPISRMKSGIFKARVCMER